MPWTAVVPQFGSERQLQSWLDTQLARCDDRQFGERFAAAISIPGIPASSYCHRILSVGGARLLAGIRFKGGDTKRPFVDLLAWDGEPEATWPAALAHEFREFQPLAFRYASRGTEPGCWRGRVDQYVVAGPAEGEWDPRIRSADDLSWYTRFAAEFERWQASSAIGEEVTATDRQDFAACLDTGFVAIAMHRDEFLGVAACRIDSERSFSGWCMQEEFVVPTHQGQGLATAMQRGLMSCMPQGSSVWGTIHRANGPSLAVARKCGRQIVETWWFSTFDGSPPVL